jgi:lipopolysaccharide assembly outer membrane protein LptD (OstA)
VHYHHQLRRITESLISMTGNVRPNSSLGISYSQNEFAYRTPENVLHPEGTTFGFNGEVPFADQFSVGFNGTLNLATQPAPLGRRLQDGLVFIDFHPICYRVRLTYEESLELTQNNGANQYFVNRRIAFTFDLGSLLSGTQQRVVATGPGL